MDAAAINIIFVNPNIAHRGLGALMRQDCSAAVHSNEGAEDQIAESVAVLRFKDLRFFGEKGAEAHNGGAELVALMRINEELMHLIVEALRRASEVTHFVDRDPCF